MTKKRYTHIDLHYMGFNEVLELINELSVKNEELKYKVNGLKSELRIWKEDANEHIQEINKLFEENDELKQGRNEMFIRERDTKNEWRKLKEENGQLKKENENLNNVLEDFMVMLNRLQANPDNEVLQSMAKDMLRMMGKDIMGDSE